MSPDEPTYGAHDTCDLAGITYRQLDYWARTHLIEPSIKGADGPGYGNRRRYSAHDVALLAVIADLLRTGARLEQIRPVVPLLAALQHHQWDQVAYIADGRIWFSLTDLTAAGATSGQFIHLRRFRDIGRTTEGEDAA